VSAAGDRIVSEGGGTRALGFNRAIGRPSRAGGKWEAREGSRPACRLPLDSVAGRIYYFRNRFVVPTDSFPRIQCVGLCMDQHLANESRS
jgi:hypothetical protein